MPANLIYGITMNTQSPANTLKSYLAATLIVFSLSGCLEEDEATSTEGYIKLYNLSEDSPAIYLTVDEDLSSDNDDDDHFEKTYTGISYGDAQSNNELTSQSYYYQLAWQDEDSYDTDDLDVIFEDAITITNDTIHMVVISGSVLAAAVTVYDIPVIDDDADSTDNLFNLRVLNMSTTQQDIDFYISKDNESFNEAVLFNQVAYQQLTDNQKLDQDDYIFYVTTAGSDEVLFTSSSIEFPYSSQNIMIVKDNKGAGSSPYVLDKMSDSAIIEYVDSESEAQLRAYNAVATQAELSDYLDNFDIHLNGVTDSPTVPELAFGEISDPLILTSGDYSLDLTVTVSNAENGTQESVSLLSNHLLSLVENTNKTVFFYAEQDYVDNDNDGDIDENGDGIIDEIDVNLYSLIVENSLLTSIYEHEIEIVNLIESDDFSQVSVYFVRQDETIDTSVNHSDIPYKSSSSIYLLNNTYQVFVVAQNNGSTIILNTFELVVDEDSREQFLVLETSNDAPTGYKTTLFDQIAETTSDIN